jgi:peptidoglycan/xylan/chitin deacetylase (PgdA/CDA1 family)
MKKVARRINHFLSERYSNFFRKSYYIQVILMHKLYENKSQIIPENGSTVEGITVAQFEKFIRYFSKRNVAFISASDILDNKIQKNKNYVFLTFDDGYYNNMWALPILEKYKALATIYVSTNHIQENKSFWWDAIYRYRTGVSEEHVLNEVSNLKKMKWEDQEQYLIKNFGDEVLKPKSDLDRPLTEKEFESISNHEYISIGNHTDNHLNMTLYSKDELTKSIIRAEEYIKKITEEPSQSFAYPYGMYDQNSIDTLRSMGFKVAVSVNEGKITASEIQDEKGKLLLKRSQLSGYIDIEDQCRNIHVNFSIASKIKNLFR